jgi:hypothetical protein
VHGNAEQPFGYSAILTDAADNALADERKE